MVKPAKSYQDNKGMLYATAEEAAATDLAALLGRCGGDNGMSFALGKLILDRRDAFRAVFDQYDALRVKVPIREAKPKADAFKLVGKE